MLIHRQLASHLELAPLLVPLCLFPIKTELKRGKQKKKKKKRRNAIFNAIFLDKHLQSLPREHPERKGLGSEERQHSLLAPWTVPDRRGMRRGARETIVLL